jgi:hypothetical protein
LAGRLGVESGATISISKMGILCLDRLMICPSRIT